MVVTFRDRDSGLIGRASELDVELTRAATGRIHGALRGQLYLGGDPAPVVAELDLVPGGAANLEVRLSALRPSAMASVPASVGFLAGVQAPVSISATAAFDAAFRLGRMQATVALGAGQVRVGGSDVALRSLSAVLSGTAEQVAISRGVANLARGDGAPEMATFSGTVTHASDRLSASLALGLEQIDVADLPRLWPVGVARDARPWVTEHVTGGMATRGSASLVIEADDGLKAVALTRATADLDVANGTFTWLDGMPPVEQAAAHLHLADPDVLEIRVSAGRQRLSGAGRRPGAAGWADADHRAVGAGPECRYPCRR